MTASTETDAAFWHVSCIVPAMQQVIVQMSQLQLAIVLQALGLRGTAKSILMELALG